MDKILVTNKPWKESVALREEEPETTYVGKFYVGSKVEVGNQMYEVKKITRRYFKNSVIHEILECDECVVLLAFDWERVKGHEDRLALMRRFFDTMVAHKYSLFDGATLKLVTWQAVKRCWNLELGESVNIVPVLFERGLKIKELVDLVDFQKRVPEVTDEYITGD